MATNLCCSDDPDVIVRVYALMGSDRSRSIVNNHLGRQGLPIQDEAPDQPRESREPTVEVEPESEKNSPFFELRFSQGPKTNRGFVFGAHSSSDVVINLTAASNFHFAIDFDHKHRLIIRDLKSTNGTTVVYNDHNYKRKVFQWIIGGVTEIQSFKIDIEVLGVKFRIMPTIFDPSDHGHAERVKRFRQGVESASGQMINPALSRQHTRVASKTATPVGNDWVFVELAAIAAGAQGSVAHVWDATTGKSYARKTSTTVSTKGKTYWLSELENLKKLSHVS
jgi:serine/threonine-protein kinase Chk2